MKNSDWTFLVVAAADGKPLSPVQLQKSLFLLSRNLTPAQLQRDSLYDFQPYDYGPFDSTVYRDGEALASADLLMIGDGFNHRTYCATPLGIKKARELRQLLDSRAASYLDEVVNWVLRQGFGDLVRAIYKSYPEMRDRSVFKD